MLTKFFFSYFTIYQRNSAIFFWRNILVVHVEFCGKFNKIGTIQIGTIPKKFSKFRRRKISLTPHDNLLHAINPISRIIIDSQISLKCVQRNFVKVRIITSNFAVPDIQKTDITQPYHRNMPVRNHFSGLTCITCLQPANPAGLVCQYQFRATCCFRISV